MSFQTIIQQLKGGSGSGNHGHQGRPGKRGGSNSKFNLTTVHDDLRPGAIKDNLGIVISHPKYSDPNYAGGFYEPKFVKKPEVWDSASDACKGEQGRCHLNSIDYAVDDKDSKLAVGFTMNNYDPELFSHVWVVKNNKVIEPTLTGKFYPLGSMSYIGNTLSRDALKLYAEDPDKLLHDVHTLLNDGSGPLVKYVE